MKELLCVCAYVYGRLYQGWIPMYVYSIIRNHPQFHVRIYTDVKLRKDVRRLLDDLDQSKFDIIEDFKNYYIEKEIEKRALRWLICDRALNKYKYVYIGDVDIYLVNEPKFLQMHLLDMENSGRIYSNAVRLTWKDFIISGAKREDLIYLYRLTGLHFYETEPYHNKLRYAQKKLLWMIEHMEEITVWKRLFLKKFFLTDDERILYYLVKKSHLKLPAVSYQKYGNSRKCYRPEHGIHFGIGRETKSYELQLKKDIQKGNYLRINEWRRNFYAFAEDYNSDNILRRFIDFDSYIQGIVNQTCMFFGYQINGVEIQKVDRGDNNGLGV